MNKPKDNIKEDTEEHFFKEIMWTLVMETHACNPVSGRLRQEGSCEFKANLSYIVSLSPAWAIEWD